MKDYSELSDCNNSGGEPLAWIHEDELPEGYPYDAMFPYSKVDVVRMFPVFGPPAAQQDASAAQAVPELTSRVVNEACWKFIDAMPHPLTPQVWNNLKPAVYAAVVHVLSAPPSEQAQTVPDGWKLVPVSLTPEMRQAWDSSPCGDDDDTNMQAAYCAMLAAAPVTDAPKGEPVAWMRSTTAGGNKWRNELTFEQPPAPRFPALEKVAPLYTAPANTSAQHPTSAPDSSLEQDAARYRWLRDDAMALDQFGGFSPYVISGQTQMTLEGDALDAAVDAAIAAKEQK